jgi:hypothetical protein
MPAGPSCSRLATTRTYWLLAAGVTALIAGGTAAAAANSFTGGVSPARSVLAIASLAQTVALVAGAEPHCCGTATSPPRDDPEVPHRGHGRRLVLGAAQWPLQLTALRCSKRHRHHVPARL